MKDRNDAKIAALVFVLASALLIGLGTGSFLLGLAVVALWLAVIATADVILAETKE